MKAKSKSKIRIVLSIIFFISIVVVGLIAINFAVSPEWPGAVYWDEFYELEDNSIEVIFLGSSQSYLAFNPVVFGEALNVDCYNLSSNGASIEQLYFSLKEVLKTQKPKVVVIESYSFIPFDKQEFLYTFMHSALDGMHLSKNKVDAIKYNVPEDKRLEYYLPFTLYHLRWKEEETLEKAKNIFTYEKKRSDFFGFQSVLYVHKEKEDFYQYITPDLLTDKELSLSKDRMKLLDNITKLCEENDIKLLFVNTPFLKKETFSYIEVHEHLKGLESYTKENDIDIIDFSFLFEDIDLQHYDFSDVGHVNSSGAYKVSLYLSDYIKKNYADLIKDQKFDYKQEFSTKFDEFMKDIDEFNSINRDLITGAHSN